MMSVSYLHFRFYWLWKMLKKKKYTYIDKYLVLYIKIQFFPFYYHTTNHTMYSPLHLFGFSPGKLIHKRGEIFFVSLFSFLLPKTITDNCWIVKYVNYNNKKKKKKVKGNQKGIFHTFSIDFHIKWYEKRNSIQL